MGYIIAGASGLVIGIGLAIWAIVERGKRAKAEVRALEADQKRAEFERAAKASGDAVAELHREQLRREQEIARLRERLDEALQLVTENASIETIKAVLDANTREETL